MLEINIVTLGILLFIAFFLFVFIEIGMRVLSLRLKKPRLVLVPVIAVLVFGIWSVFVFFDPLLPYPDLFWERGFLPMPDAFWGGVVSVFALLGCGLGCLLTRGLE